MATINRQASRAMGPIIAWPVLNQISKPDGVFAPFELRPASTIKQTLF